MSARKLPVRPDLEQLRHKAKDLLRAARLGDPGAVADFRDFHPNGADPAAARLADAQLVLARSYEAASWPRLVQACELVDAIWRDDSDAVRALITRHPRLRDEMTIIRPDSNWGAPMAYAANLGRDRIVRMLHELGARDIEHAMDRAVLQSQVSTAALLHELMGRSIPPRTALDGAAYTLSAAGTAFLFRVGMQLQDEHGECRAPVDVVLETDSRKPTAKHEILAMYEQHGFTFPDTPTMALHRGRIDLLEAHLARDPGLLTRTFPHAEIYPPALGCHDEILATHGTPLAGTTLLHMCADYDEFEIAEWLLARGADPNARASVDAEGFGGHTAIFSTVVSQPAFWMNYGHRELDARFTKLFLDHGAEVNVRASLRKQLHPGYDEHALHEYRDVSPLSWGRRFHRKEFVNGAALALIEAKGGRE